MSTTPGRHLTSFSWSATKAKTSGRGRLTTMLFSAAGIRATLTGDERSGKVVGVERPQVFKRFSDADELDREAQLVCDRDGDATLRAAVELRQRDARDADGFAEEARLLQAVLSGRRVDDEQRLVRCAFELSFDHPAHLRQLLHQIRLRVETSGGVDDHDVAPVSGRALDCVIGNR